MNQTGVRDAARASGVRLWMSENDTPLDKDPEDFEGMASPLAFAEHVVLDLKRLEPAAWVLWQAVETLERPRREQGLELGLVKADYRSPPEGPQHDPRDAPVLGDGAIQPLHPAGLSACSGR
ncbi:hypothetical protein ACRAWD_09605 [Caulobacter segnis]